MNLTIVEKDEKITGLILAPDNHPEEDSFVNNFPENLRNGLVDIRIVDDEILIENGNDGVIICQVPKELTRALEDYVRNKEKISLINTRSFPCKFP